MAIDKITSAAITDGTITSSDLASGAVQNQSAFKNLFINGDMSIAQRGTTSSSTGYQTVDRWQLNTGTQQEQKTDTPDARFSKSFEVTGTTSGSSGYGICSQRIESKNVLQALGQTCTLSAYVKNTGTSTVNVSCEVYRANSTDTFSGLTLLTSLTSQAITTGWTRITFPSFTVTDACSTGLEVRIFRYDASNDQEWLLTGVQLEVGSSASDFEFLPHDVTKRRCYRYYYRINFGSGLKYVGFGQVDNDNQNIPAICNIFPEQMRTAPTALEQSGTASHYKIREAGTYSCTSVPTFSNASTWNATVTFKRSGITSSDGFAQGELLKCGGESGHLGWSAEL